MRIPTHQIHNVLNAYAKRLKKQHDAKNGTIEKGSEDSFGSYSIEDKRRMIINKISADIIDKIIRTQPRRKRSEPESDTADQGRLQKEIQTEMIRYNIINKHGEKVSAKMKILDPDYLITQLEEIARKASEK